MDVCICDLACLHPACPSMACCPWQMGAARNHRCSRQEPGDLYLRPILSAFQQSLWVCWHISKASLEDLAAVYLWAVEALRCSAQALQASLSNEGLAAEQCLCWLQGQWQISGVFL